MSQLYQKLVREPRGHCKTQNMADVNITCELLYKTGCYDKVKEVISSTPPLPEFGNAYRYSILALIDQGLIGQAVKALDAALLHAFTPEIHHQLACMRLYLAFLDGSVTEAFQALETYIQEKLFTDYQPSEQPSRFLHLLGRDYLLRASAIVQTQGKLSLDQWQHNCQQIREVASGYQQLGYWEEACHTLLRGASSCFKLPYENFSLAHHWIQEVIQTAKEKSDYLLWGDALLINGELGYYQIWKQDPQSPSEDALLNNFQQAATAYQKGGHEYPESKSLCVLGHYLLKYGVPEGVGILEEAIEDLEKKKDYKRSQSALMELHQWYDHRGNFEQAKKIKEKIQTLDLKMNIRMANHTSQLREAESLFKQGAFSKALSVLTALIGSDSTSLISRPAVQMKAVILSQLGRHEEALQIFQTLITLEENEALTPHLAELYVHASMACKKQPLTATAYLEKAIKLYHELGDTFQEGSLLMLKAFEQVQLLHHNNPLYEGSLPPVILKNFEQSRALLLGYRHFEAMKTLGRLCCYWGQACFMVKDYDSCFHWLNQAEQIYQEYALLPELVFLYAYQGMVLITIGRTGDLACYDAAYTAFEKSEAALCTSKITGTLWRIQFYKGLAKYEWGERLQEPARKDMLHKEADQCFWQALDNLDQLKEQLGITASYSGQLAGLHFMEDKQVFLSTAFNNSLNYLNNTAHAVFWLEKMKGQSLLETLKEGHLEELFQPNPTLKAKEAKLLHQLHSETNWEHYVQIKQKLTTLYNDYETDTDSVPYLRLRRAEVIQWEEIKQLLAEEERRNTPAKLLMLSYYVQDQQILVFGMRTEWSAPRVEHLAVDVPALVQFKADFQNNLPVFSPSSYENSSLENTTRSLRIEKQTQDFFGKSWHAFSELIKPIQAWAEPGDIIYLIPHGLLHDLPLHILQLDKTYLMERNPVAYLPSLSLLPYVLRPDDLLKHNSGKMQLFGNPTHDLPFAEQEVKKLATAFNAQCYIKNQVSREQILKAFNQCNIVHFAGHAKFSEGEGWQSGLVIGNEELLTAKDLIGLPFRCRFTALSGCETGLSKHIYGDELVGLTRIFLLAGVQTLLVSQWKVNDSSTQLLFMAFYDNWINEGYSPVVSLQKAVMSVKEKFPSPYDWAPFVLTGNWRLRSL